MLAIEKEIIAIDAYIKALSEVIKAAKNYKDVKSSKLFEEIYIEKFQEKARLNLKIYDIESKIVETEESKPEVIETKVIETEKSKIIKDKADESDAESIEIVMDNSFASVAAKNADKMLINPVKPAKPAKSAKPMSVKQKVQRYFEIKKENGMNFCELTQRNTDYLGIGNYEDIKDIKFSCIKIEDDFGRTWNNAFIYKEVFYPELNGKLYIIKNNKLVPCIMDGVQQMWTPGEFINGKWTEVPMPKDILA
jgi:hypothetical protein